MGPAEAGVRPEMLGEFGGVSNGELDDRRVAAQRERVRTRQDDDRGEGERQGRADGDERHDAPRRASGGCASGCGGRCGRAGHEIAATSEQARSRDHAAHSGRDRHASESTGARRRCVGRGGYSAAAPELESAGAAADAGPAAVAGPEAAELSVPDAAELSVPEPAELAVSEAAEPAGPEAAGAEAEGANTVPRMGRSRSGSPSEKTALTGAVESGSPLRLVPTTFDSGSTDVPASGYSLTWPRRAQFAARVCAITPVPVPVPVPVFVPASVLMFVPVTGAATAAAPDSFAGD